MRQSLALAGTVLLALIALSSSRAASDDALERADAAWARRAEGQQDGVPNRAGVTELVRLYAERLAANPSSLEARWKLLRALHFDGEFATSERDEKGLIFDRGRRLAEEGVKQLDELLGKPPHRLDLDELRERIPGAGLTERDLAAFYFWSSVHWGAWARIAGLLGAVRRGAAGHMHDYALVSLALEPAYEGGGAHRMVSALNARLPRVPFVSGWVDRSQALPHAQSALELAPGHPGNLFLVAVTLLDLYPERRGEALSMLEQVVEAEPRPDFLVEDLAVVRSAQRRLDRAKGPDAD
jgi:hypothetical protein